MEDNFDQFELAEYTGPEGLNPAVATEKEWSKIRKFTSAPAGGKGRWVFFEPRTTRGLRLKILAATPPQVANIAALHAYTDLGDQPVPEWKPGAEEPPLRIPYALAEDGIMTLAIEDAQGKRVRNLAARIERNKGQNAEPWNLKDEKGNAVGTGEYRWKGIAHPPLRLLYQMTPYPNIGMHAPENSAWLNGQSGPGGWMADHTPPICVAAAGARVYMSSPVCESGVGLIECTLEGRKLWGTGNLTAWTSPSYLAGDGKAVYGAAPAWSATGAQEYLWRVNVETKEIATLFALPNTDERRRGIRGLEARNGKVYTAINAVDDYLCSAVGAVHVDLKNCYPPYKEVPMRGLQDEDQGNPQWDFLRLFRLKDAPPGNKGLTWLESTSFPASKNHIVLAFTKPAPIGSLAFPVPAGDKDVTLKLSVLKADAPYPADPFKESYWETFWKGTGSVWIVVALPDKTVTRALRITFAKGDDELSDMLNEGPKAELDEGIDVSKLGGGERKEDSAMGGKGWAGRLEGMKLLKRRFASLLATATIRVNSGRINKDGEWEAQRTKPLSAKDPGIYAMEWKEPRKVRGLAIKEIDGKRTEIDVYDGPAGVAIDIGAEANWRHVKSYEQPLRDCYDGRSQAYNANARYLDGYVDFGVEIETRAVRLRVVEQWTTRGHYPSCVRLDRGGGALEPARCRVYGVAPVQYIGGEVPVDPRVAERIEIVDGTAGKIEQEVHVKGLGPIAFTPAGDLYGISGTNVIKVDLAGGRHQTVIADLIQPSALGAGQDGNLYVFDAASGRKVVRVYDTTGRFLRSIGTPGGFKAGAWDPTRFGDVKDLDIDEKGQMWVVEWQYFPKRITMWTAADGKFQKEFLGNTAYGGGGVLDPYDKRRLFYGPLEFELDWDKGTTRLKNLTWAGGDDAGKMFNPSAAGELPVRIGDRLYLTTRAEMSRQQCGVVYLYEKDHLRRVAAVGLANGFGALNVPDILASLPGGKPLADLQFIWTDRNGDGNPQPGEVQFSATRIGNLTSFDRTLGVQAGAVRYQVKEFLPDGAPVYEEKDCRGFSGDPGWMLDKDRFFFFRGANYQSPPCEAVCRPDGTDEWAYRTEGYGVHALYNASPWRRDQVVSEFDVIGHETAHAGDLGEFVVTHSNVGIWNIWTADGLLAGGIFRDLRDPKAQAWSMKEHGRGLRLEECTAGQEHFAGYFCRTADDKYYVVAGHNHASVVEVAGMDRFKRLSGTVKVTDDDIKKAAAWEYETQKRKSYEEARIVECRIRGDRTIIVDGDDSEWDVASAVLSKDDPSVVFRMLYDNSTLFLCYTVSGRGPMKNTGNDWHTYYKTGACVDLQMSTKPEADPKRTAPAEGDFRLLMTAVNSKPAAVLYRPVAPGTPQDQGWNIHTLVSSTTFDRVEKLEDAQLAFKDDGSRYVYEAAIPLKSLGLTLQPDLRLKLDWGFLVSGKDGNEVLQRVYWANKATAIVSDVSYESQLHPDLWGFVRFSGKAGEGWRPETPDGGNKAASEEEIMDLLEGK